MDNEPFTPADAGAVHQAMIEAEAQAAERKERMPNSAKALEKQAGRLAAVRDKIVERLPAEERTPYPKRAKPAPP